MQLKDFVFSVFEGWANASGTQEVQNDALYDSFIANSYGPRLFIHDVAHLVAGTGFYLHSEEAAGIVHAVLTRDVSVSTSRRRTHPDSQRPIPAFSEFDETFFDGIKKHSHGSYQKLHPDKPLPQTQFVSLTTEERRFYYDLACAFDRQFEARHQCPFYTFDANRLSEFDARAFVNLIQMVWTEVNYIPTHRLATIMLSEASHFSTHDAGCSPSWVIRKSADAIKGQNSSAVLC